MAGLLTATVVAVVGPILVYVWPPSPKGQRKSALTVTLNSDVDSVPPQTAVQFNAPANSAFLMATGGGENAAGDPTFGGFLVNPASGSQLEVFASRCPHLGCSFGFDQQAKIFKCPCHGSQFDLHGNVIHGPASANLAKLSWKRGSQPNQLVVDGLILGQGQ
jgi:Rieske Fe-S protein